MKLRSLYMIVAVLLGTLHSTVLHCLVSRAIELTSCAKICVRTPSQNMRCPADTQRTDLTTTAVVREA
jgi:hypothetical protein